MFSVYRLLNPLSECETAAAFLLRKLDVKFTPSYLQARLHEHPDYPGLLSIVDVLEMNYRVPSLAVRMNSKDLVASTEFTAPFLAHIKHPGNGSLFGVITTITSDLITLYNPATQKATALTLQEFDAIYLGHILLVECDEHSEEKDYAINKKAETRKINTTESLFWSLPLITIICCIVSIVFDPPGNLWPKIAFLLVTLSGGLVSAVLLWREVEEHNPAIRKICRNGRRINCSAVLNSKASRIFGFSWSSIGASFFLGMLLSLLLGGLENNANLFLLSWLNVLALPYVAFSIFYQWRVARQWCLLCLLVQSTLILQLGAALLGGFHNQLQISQVAATNWVSLLAAFAFSTTTILVLLPALLKARENGKKLIDLKKIKYNQQVFEEILGKQKSIENPGDGLGITLGNKEGTAKIVMVCSPYCAPCARAHPLIESVIEKNENILFQIIFTATDNDADIKKAPVNHFLAIDSGGDKALVKKALNDWYHAPQKIYESFADKYPVATIVNNQSEKIRSMDSWCERTNIEYTPAFYLSLNSEGPDAKLYELPGIYSETDLEYFMK